MPRTIEKIPFSPSVGEEFDEIIDVRSPGEFSEDHLSGAVNLPVLSNDERCEVGTLYKQVSAFAARKVGAAMVSKNIARHLESHFSDKPRDYRPLVYCWRGGQRSGSLATVLADIGWPAAVIDGGYRSYRKNVIDTIEEMAASLSLIVLNGFTGAGKTLILKHLIATGEQVLELEGMARHKGSVFGGDADSPQPAQKRFESLIFDQIVAFDLERPVFVEAESAKIGRLNLPNPLWQVMKQGSVIKIDSPLASRADYLADDYADWIRNPDRIADTIERLRAFHARDRIAAWKTMAYAGESRQLITELLAEHYDTRYHIGGEGNYAEPVAVVPLRSHDDDSVRRCAAEVIRHADHLSRPVVSSTA